MTTTLAATFADIVHASLPTQDRVDLARYLLDTRLVHVTARALAQAIDDTTSTGATP